MEEKLENVNILKEKRAAVDLPFSISSTVPSFSLGHLKVREDDIVKEMVDQVKRNTGNQKWYITLLGWKSCNSSFTLNWWDPSEQGRSPGWLAWPNKSPKQWRSAADRLRPCAPPHTISGLLPFQHSRCWWRGGGSQHPGRWSSSCDTPLGQLEASSSQCYKQNTHNDFRRNPLTGICWLLSSTV